jgi:hypothetical protein
MPEPPLNPHWPETVIRNFDGRIPEINATQDLVAQRNIILNTFIYSWAYMKWPQNPSPFRGVCHYLKA